MTYFKCVILVIYNADRVGKLLRLAYLKDIGLQLDKAGRSFSD